LATIWKSMSVTTYNRSRCCENGSAWFYSGVFDNPLTAPTPQGAQLVTRNFATHDSPSRGIATEPSDRGSASAGFRKPAYSNSSSYEPVLLWRSPVSGSSDNSSVCTHLVYRSTGSGSGSCSSERHQPVDTNVALDKWRHHVVFLAHDADRVNLNRFA
jgi:hypothetical protein